MNKLTTTIFERAYQSYLCGGDVYTYRFESKSCLMMKKYTEAIKYLEDNGLVIVKFMSEDKVKLSLTDKGIEYGNSMSV
ncbi:hypothetical protein [[Clostridium] colinum]|uniref:hypothetical protein n=1 Tax=[Clostridium] colinum TaxID=36835 RepID=UPI0020241FDA|nr:hypothetical protein [[Clostridium] colinum]